MGSIFLNFAKKCSLLPKKVNFHEISRKKENWTKMFILGNRLSFKAKLKKGDPTLNLILLSREHHPTNRDLFLTLAMASVWSDLTFTHFCLVNGNLLPNFLTTVTHSFFNIMSSVIPLDKNGGSGEKNAQVEILI